MGLVRLSCWRRLAVRAFCRGGAFHRLCNDSHPSDACARGRTHHGDRAALHHLQAVLVRLEHDLDGDRPDCARGAARLLQHVYARLRECEGREGGVREKKRKAVEGC